MNEINPILSLCIPTNGVTEWVVPVLDSIYKKSLDEELYEVVIENNGDNEDFERTILEYSAHHTNLKYYVSNSQGFLCQIDCFKHARGQFIKFINHRFLFFDDTIDFLIKFAKDNIDEKPVVFFSNGMIKGCECSSFDSFVDELSYWSSWSGGLAFWKDDLEFLSEKERFNAYFPHTDILFLRRNPNSFIITDKKLFSEIDAGHSAKGKYNLFNVFAVEYLAIILDLERDGAISTNTFLDIKNSLLKFLADLYVQFIILKKPASYSFEDYREYLKVFYSKREFRQKVLWVLFKRVVRHFSLKM